MTTFSNILLIHFKPCMCLDCNFRENIFKEWTARWEVEKRPRCDGKIDKVCSTQT